MKRKPLKFLFDPSKRGVRSVLGELETAIMEIVWDEGSASVRTVHETLGRKRPLAYTTVMTVMSRLAGKGLLRKTKDNAAFVYHPALTRDEFASESVRSVLQGLLKDFSKPTLSQFVESVRDSNQVAELERLIEQERKKR